jgi:hypothetical protein
MSSNKVILRVEKLKTIGEIAAMTNHWLRTRPTPNSDPNRRKRNRIVHGASNPHQEFKELIKRKKITKFRKNGVLMLEFVLTFSPEYIRDSSTGALRPDANQRVKEWLILSRKWMLEKFGDNCISIIYHACERTPHIHCVVCPLELKTRKSGKTEWALNARAITGGADKLSRLQDSYAEALESTGLKRGIKGSKAKHTTLKQFYGAISESKRECEKLNLPSPSTTPNDLNSWRETMAKIISSLKASEQDDSIRLNRVIDELVKTNHKLESQLANYQRAHHRRYH